MTATDELTATWESVRGRYATLLIDALELEPPLRAVAVYGLGGGKRVRPLLVELMGRVVAAPAEALTSVAIAVEYLHTASVLLDDLKCMDDAAERRGLPPTHVRFSEADAILTAVALLSRAYAVLLEAPADAEIDGAMTRTACATVGRFMATGQALELEAAPADARAVQSIHARKTASLFTLAAELTALCGGASPETTRDLVQFAMLLGLAYQIVDDLEDRAETGEARANLARVAGAETATAMARGVLGDARKAASVDATGGLAGCVDWLEQRLDALA